MNEKDFASWVRGGKTEEIAYAKPRNVRMHCVIKEE